MRTHQTILTVIAIWGLVLFIGCNRSISSDRSTTSVENDGTCSDKNDNTTQNSDTISERGKEFIDTFSQDHPDFILLDYALGSDENKPIILVAVAENEKDGTSSTLFVVDENGVGQQIGLASGAFATYRQEDDLILEDNVIFVSLDLKSTDTNYEVHDFQVTVTQNEYQGAPNTVYASKETIRSKE